MIFRVFYTQYYDNCLKQSIPETRHFKEGAMGAGKNL